ncbi:MAG: hypothetical protein EHM58_18920 [Ignavibacteriae bacterium]|nr:MAG: hypothetical protein EHM58_18920 [Ignavibacteriota bacterium]
MDLLLIAAVKLSQMEIWERGDEKNLERGADVNLRKIVNLKEMIILCGIIVLKKEIPAFAGMAKKL